MEAQQTKIEKKLTSEFNSFERKIIREVFESCNSKY